MKFYRCDNCKKDFGGEPKVEINNDSSVLGKGAILLPNTRTGKDFCTEECFWKWVQLNRPEEKTEDDYIRYSQASDKE